jgi:hypothetical protein
MAAEKTQEMNEHIAQRVRGYVISYSAIFVLLLWGNRLLAAALNVLKNRDQSDLAKTLAAPAVAALGGVVIFLLNLGRDWDLHNVLDSRLFGVRRETDQRIQTAMVEAARGVNAAGSDRMERDPRKVLHLFYHFVNDQEPLRSLAFTYWEQYFVNLYTSVLCGIGLAGSVTISVVRWHGWSGPVASATFLVLGATTLLRTFRSLVGKIYDLPVQQVDEIRHSKLEEFKLEVERRFADHEESL